jgi:branched-chain amino acid transport system permease protein
LRRWGIISAAPEEDPAAQPSSPGVAPARRGTLREYVVDHVLHLVVLLAFGLYPFAYRVAVTTPVGGELALILPPTTAMIPVFYVGLFAMSFDFISGYTGYLSFGHAMFYGTGAYLVVMTATDKLPLAAGTPFMALLVLAGLLGGALALFVGAISFRLRGVYFAMITLGFAEIGRVFVRNWRRVSTNPRNGAAVASAEGFAVGLPGIDALNVRIGRLVGDSYESLFGLGIELSTAEVSYYAVGAVVLICYLALKRITHSPFGSVMIIIRENEERAKAIGYNTYRYKLGAFAVSGFFASVAGGLFAGYQRSVAPENSLTLFVTADALLAAVIGGFGTLAGSLYGHLFHVSLKEILTTDENGLAFYLRDTLPEGVLMADVAGVTVRDVVDVLLAGRAELYIGLVFVAFVLLIPEGLLGALRDRLGSTVSKWVGEKLDSYLRE